ncbi:MAG TPA: hypothetical protein VFD77_05035 [Brumimicrobium sp.]|nr:hypothetical protein [Brumimicrobium sp.]
MKLKLTSILLLIFGFILSSTIASAQSVFPNDVILQPYYGAPNMKKWMYDTDLDQYNSSKGFGHVGLSGEFVISSRFGFGFDAIYSPFERTETTSYIEYDGNTNTTINKVDELVFSENKLRIIAKAYIHFNVANPLWDLYISGGIGPNIIFKKAYFNDEKVNYDAYHSNSENIMTLNPHFPFSGRICFGARYFFSNHFGASFETGFGGPPFSFGLNARF